MRTTFFLAPLACTSLLLSALHAQGPARATAPSSPAPAARQPVPQSYKDLKYPKLNPIRIPKVERSVLSNGITLFLVEDKELPLIRASAIIRTGDRYDPAGKAGLADITLRVMRTGGTPTRSGDDLDKELDRLGGSVESGSGQDSSTASVFVLKQDMEKGLSILADILRNPAFPQEKIDLVKIDARDTISRRNDDAMGIHYRETGRLLYGKSSPYAAQPEYATLDSITRDDLIAFHKEYFQPENLIVGVWGDINAAATKALVEKLLGSWPKGGHSKPGVPTVDMAAQARGIHFVKKEDVNQSTIGMSMLLGKRSDPDYHAMVVMTSVLGGGFGSRMFDEIRTKAGLAYAAYAGYSVGWDHNGSWTARVGTKSETTMQALDLMRREIARIQEAEVTDDELQRAKDNILKGEAFDYDSTGKVITRLMTLDYYGYPADFLDKYRAGVDKVTKADVLRVAREHLKGDRFVTLILGNDGKFDKPLSALGSVSSVDITIPEPKAAAAAAGAATPESEQKAKALLDKARQAHGAAAIAGAKDYTAKLDMALATPQGEFNMKAEATVSLAGKATMKMASPMGEIVQVFDGTNVWMKSPQGVQQMPASMTGQARASSLRETLSLLKNYDKPGYQVQSLGSSKFGEMEAAEAVLIRNESAKLEVKVYLDPKTGLVSGKSYVGPSMMGPPAEINEVYSDFREADGVKLPFRSVLSSGGKRSGEQKITEFKLNTGVTDDAFQKPQ